MFDKRKNIIWLASWYPNKFDPFTGDFIQRHAEAASLINNIHVLFVLRNGLGQYDEKPNEEKQSSFPGLSTTTTYYRSPYFKIKGLDALFSAYKYLRVHYKFLRKYIKENGKPHGIHVHVAMRAGLGALMIKWIFGITYMFSEHWSGLCQGAEPSFNGLSPFERFCWKMIMKNARGYTAVSKYLAQAMKEKFSLINVDVIPNVVNKNIFFPSLSKPLSSQFIHISTLNFPKNPEQLMEAVAIVKNRIPDFKLFIFGEVVKSVQSLVDLLKINEQVVFKGPAAQSELRKFLQESRALILYSRFETFGCVIIEANACGVPVIVSDIPVFHENVLEGITGIFVPLNNSILLAESIYEMATDRYMFNQKEIVQHISDKYSYEKISVQFDHLYRTYFT